MHTFVVRLFQADDLTDLEGILEDPASGLRVTFHDAGELARSMRAATLRAGDPKAVELDPGSDSDEAPVPGPAG